MLAASKSAVRSDSFRYSAFPKPEAAPKEFDAMVWAERQRENSTPINLEVMIAALQAQRSGLKVAA